MTLTEARDWVRNAVEDGTDSTTYSNTDVDRAIQTAGEYFCRHTRCLKRVDTVTLAAADETFTLTTPVANGFRPERLIDVFLVGFADPLSVIDYSELNAAQAEDAAEGTPEALAFLDWTTAAVWPTPDILYTAKLRYWLPFTDWTAGTASPDSVTLNLPKDYLLSVLSDGAASVLTAADKSAKFGTAAGARFLAYVRGMAGAGGFGTKVVYRNKLD